MSDLVQIARARVTEVERTHWEGCERDHFECLIQRMADEIERLREWIAVDTLCPCCQQTQQCNDDCTFAVEDPCGYERIVAARECLVAYTPGAPGDWK